MQSGKTSRPAAPAPAGFPARLRETREAAGLTPEECARRIKRSAETWRAWERGDTEPKLIDGAAAAKLLRVSLIWLVTGEK